MSGTTTSVNGAANQAFFAALLPNLESQIVNEFQFTGLTTLQSFESQFSSSTKYLQLSTTQVALSTGGSAYTLLIQGTGLSIPGASVAGVLNTGSLSLASVAGSVTAAQLYSGGTFHNGAVTGGTVVASGVFSATKLTLSAGSLGVVINGANMPTTPATVAAIAAGTYTGPAISVSSVQILNNGTQVGSITLGATSITFISDDYKLVLNGTFPTSLSSSVIDSLIGTRSSNPLGISLTSAQLSRVSTGQVLLTVPTLSYQEFTGTDINNLPGAIASIAAAAAAGDSASINTGTLQTAVDATLNGSTMQVAGIGTAAVLGFTGDSAVTASNPSIDGTAVITNLVSGQTAAGAGVLNAAGIFVNGGTILAGGPAGSTMTVDVTAAVTNGVTTQGRFTNDAKITANAGNQLTIAVSSGATLVNNGTFVANGGSIFVDILPGGSLTPSGVATIGSGGTIETNAGGAGSRFVFTDGAAGDRLKIDAPGTFSGAIQGFRAGDTIDLGGSLAAGSLTYTASTGTLLLDNSGGTVLAGVTVSGLGLASASGTFASTGTVGQFIISRGANGDTLLTTTAAATAVVSSGTLTIPSDQTLIGNTIEAAGLSGPAVLNFYGDSGISAAAPTVDAGSVITNAIPGQTGTGQTALNANGDFVNDGIILANGPAGSTFTVNIATNRTTPGYFINYGSIIADAGNTVVINVANNAALFNPGIIIANGGSVLINAAGGLDGGYVPVLGVAAIENGGTLETNASYLSGLSGTTPTYLFLDGVAGDTLKLDHASQIGARISNFQAGDTIDLGGSLAIGTIVYNFASSVLALENSAGTILASFVMGGIATGTYAVNGVTGVAGPYVVSRGADGDTLLTTTTATPEWNDTSGTWQTAAGWSGSIVPTASLAANIGLGSTAAFTLTTGSAPVAANTLNEYDPNALVRITSSTTIAGNSINLYNGSLEVTAGNTLTGENVRLYTPSDLLTIDQGALLNLHGRLNSNFENGGTIAITNGNSSAVAVNGSVLVNGGTLNAGPGNGQDGGSFSIGYDGDGTPANVTVENGGSVTDTYTLLGSGPTSSGTLVLTGVGTTWTDEIDPGDTFNTRGYMIVGFNNLAADAPWAGQPPLAGTAQLTVENGATLTDTRAWIGDTGDSAGAVTVSNGGVWNIGVASGGYLDLSTGGAATLSILNNGTVNVGNPAAYPVQTGTFVNNGATVTASSIGVGFTAGASGTITVSGTGSALNDAYGLALGVTSQGVLDVVNAGTAYLYGAITAGVNAGASGTILVSGAKSSLTANQINVGNAGTGLLTVANGGSVEVGGTLAVGGSTTGRNGAATGTVNVNTGGTLQAAYGLAIWAGSTVSVDATSGIDVGFYGNYTLGAVRVDPYSALIGDGVVAAGVNNSGTIEATNNAAVASSSGGKLEITGAVTGTGSIAIASGATLQLDSALSSGQTIAFLSGSAPETLILGAPTGTMTNTITGFAAGDKIEFANGVTVTAASILNGNTLAVIYHNALNVTGTYNLTGVSSPPGALSVGTDPATNDASVMAIASTVSVIASFSGTIAANIRGGLVSDAKGDLFGATYSGGSVGYGSIFEIANTATGYASAPITLASFTSANGTYPWNGLAIDTAGDLFGTTSSGGTSGIGTVFELANSPTGYASAPLTLVSASYSTAASLQGQLTLDANGDLFGASNSGTVYEVAKTASGYASSFTLLATFNSANGASPIGGLITDAIGDLFGTTQSGGGNGRGTVFEIAKTAAGYAAAPATLVAFSGTNGSNPEATLTTDANGDLFGTTFSGGAYNDGTVFEIVKTASGYAASPTVLASLNYTNGAGPTSGLLVDAKGDLFGTASTGGTGGYGTVFEIAKTSAGYASVPIVLENFSYTSGGTPVGTLIADAKGNLLGATATSGASAGGAVFEITNSGFAVSAASPPVITGTQPGITTTDTVAVAPFAHVIINDPNVNQTETVTVTLSSAANGAVTNPGAGSYNATTGIYTVTGTAAAVTAALDALVFMPSAYKALPGQTTTTGFTISDTDTAAVVASDAITSVIATATGTLATIASGGTLIFAGGLPTGEAIAFSPGAPETLILGSLSVTTPNLITGWTLGDRIEFTNGITITGEQVLSTGLAISYSAAGGITGTYNLTGLTGYPTTGFNIGNDPVTNDTYIMPTQYFAWSGTSSNTFAAGGSWTNSVAPGSTGVAQFYNGIGGTISGSGSVEAMNFFNTEAWALASGAYLSTSLYVSVGGNSGTTKITIGSGGTIASAGYINVGNAAGGAGILTISGGGLLTQSAPINLSNYAMSIGSSPASGTLAAASGSVMVTGAGSMIDLGYNGLVLANNGGNASLTVSQGGSLLATTTNSNSGNSLSIGRLGNGTLTVTDAGSQVTAVGEAYVSHSGTGILTVQNYGTFIAAADLTGLAGLTIGSGNTVGVGGAGYATVTTGGDLISQGYVAVGIRGTTGNLSVLNNGTVQVGSTLTIGSSGTIQNGATYAGNGTVSIGAGGTIELTGGAQTAAYGVSLTESNIDAVSAASNGVLSVSGAGALLNTDGNGIAVGHYGSGTLTVSQGGSVVSGTANSTLIAALAIGRQGSGTVTVTGAGSQLTANGLVYVGRAGAGSLNILNQGVVLVGADGTGVGGVDIGGAGISNDSFVCTGGSGTATVSGGGILSSTQNIAVGVDGTSGTLSVAGGTVQAGTNLVIGASITLPAGDTNITPAGTTVTTAASVLNGAGLVTVGTGGVVRVAANGLVGARALIIGTTSGATGTLSVAGGTVTAFGGLSIAQGSTVSVTTGGIDIGGSGVISSGAIDVDGGFALSGDGLIQAAGINNNGTIDALNGGTLTLAGGITGTGTLALAGGATLHLTSAIDAGQTIAFGAGSAETLILDKPGSGLSNAVTGFANGDRIEFAGGMAITSAAMVNGTTIAIGFTNAGGTAGVYDVTGAGSHRLSIGTDATTGDGYIQALPAIGSDLNGDGTGDIVWRNAGTGQTLGFLMNNGTLSNAIGLLYNTAWTAAGTGDFNGDGTGDILWRNAGTGQVIEYLLNNGTVSSAVNLLYSPVWTVAGIGDFNGDGTSDILWRNASTGQVVEYLMNNGTEASTVNLLYSTAWTVAGTGDFTGDGTSDILWRNTISGQMEEYVMNNGTLASAINLLTDIDSTVVGTGDFTGNGIDDILLRNRLTGSVTEEVMNASGQIARSIVLLTSQNWTVAGTGDYTGNGSDDILWRNAGTGQVLEGLMSGGVQTSFINLIYNTAWQVSGSPVSESGTIPPVDDFNGAGQSDILWVNTVTGEVNEWQNNGAVSGDILTSTVWSVAGAGNFTGNGVSDILWRNAATGQVLDWQMNGTTEVSSTSILIDPNATVVGTGDFYGNGNSAILMHNATTGATVEYEMAGSTVINETTLLTNVNWTPVGVGDFNGDGTSDILWRNPTTGAVVMWNMTGGAPSATMTLLTDPNWTVAGVGDFNGNGMSDILWRNAGSGQVLVWMMNGSNVLSSTTLLTDPNATVTGVGDYTGNGNSDILMTNSTTGRTVEYLMNGSSVTGTQTLLTDTAWHPVTSLLNGG